MNFEWVFGLDDTGTITNSLVILCHVLEIGKEIVETTGLRYVCRYAPSCMYSYAEREPSRDPDAMLDIDQVSRRCQLQIYLQRKSNLKQTAPWVESGVLHFDGFAISPGVHRHGQKISHWKPAGLGMLLLSDLSSVPPPAKGPSMGTFLFKVLQVICGHTT